MGLGRGAVPLAIGARSLRAPSGLVGPRKLADRAISRMGQLRCHTECEDCEVERPLREGRWLNPYASAGSQCQKLVEDTFLMLRRPRARTGLW